MLLVDKGMMAFSLMSLGVSISVYELEFEYNPLNPATHKYGKKALPMLWMLFIISCVLVLLNMSRRIMFVRFYELTTGKRLIMSDMG